MSWASVIMHKDLLNIFIYPDVDNPFTQFLSIPCNPLKLEFLLVWNGQTDYRGVEGEKEQEQTESVHCVGQDWTLGGIKPYYIGNWTEKV